MATVLLISPDATFLSALTAQLRLKGHVVRCTGELALEAIDSADSDPPPEIVAVDVTQFGVTERRTLERSRQLWLRSQSPILILCWSRIWRGPRFVLEIERMGARFVYSD